jgi:nucleoside-diphosphate-sugar epimerase
MRVLVPGPDSYLGRLVAPLLVQRGHEVVGLDIGYYRSRWLYEGVPVTVQTWHQDIRRTVARQFEGFDALAHTAELTNDPAGEIAPHVTHEINHRGSLHIASLARRARVERFVYTSSCSV